MLRSTHTHTHDGLNPFGLYFVLLATALGAVLMVVLFVATR